MSSSVAVVILAHNNPPHVRRLIRALRGLDVFLHCDTKTPDDVLAAMTEGLPDVVLTPRFRTAWAQWGMVEGELAGIRTALNRSQAEHIVVASGSCYPLVSVGELEDELRSWRGLSRLEMYPIPYHPNWSTRVGGPDGGLWRFNRRFLRIGNRLLLARRRYPIPIGRRPVPAMLKLHCASQWKIYAREHAQALLRVLDERPDLVRFWHGAYTPDETCVVTMLSSPELVGSVADQLRFDRTWFIDWYDGEGFGGHPRWLNADDFPSLQLSRARRPLQPDDERERAADARKLFARKFGPDADELLDLIDQELRV